MSREFRYSITRICLRTGSLTLPQPMIELFPDQGSVEAWDAERDATLELRVEPPRRVYGLEAFFREHDLRVNDQIAVRPLEDGRFALTARPRPRRTRDDEGAVRKAVQSLREGGVPMSEEELRAAHELGPDAPLERALITAPDLERRAGRWSPRSREQPRVTPQPRGPSPRADAALNSAREEAGEVAGADANALERARQGFRRLGFRVEGLRRGSLALHADLGRGRYLVLLQVLAEGAAPDWRRLLAQRRELGADYLAVLGDVRDLHPLERTAVGADATLWSWDGLDRALQLAGSVLLGPVDLEAPFAGEGLHDASLERFESGLAERIAERGAVSDVLTRLAALRAPAVFLLDDLADGHQLSREQLVRILDRLAEAPFQLVVHRGQGEYALRHAVPDALEHLAAYALSLRDRLPDRTRARIRGAADEDTPRQAAPGDESASASETEEPEPLGSDEIEAGLARSSRDL